MSEGTESNDPASSPAALALERATAIVQLQEGTAAIGQLVLEIREPVEKIPAALEEVKRFKIFLKKLLIVISVFGALVTGFAAATVFYGRELASNQRANHEILQTLAKDDKILTDATGADAQAKSATTLAAAIAQLSHNNILADQCLRDGATNIEECVAKAGGSPITTSTTVPPG